MEKFDSMWFVPRLKGDTAVLQTCPLDLTSVILLLNYDQLVASADEHFLIFLDRWWGSGRHSIFVDFLTLVCRRDSR